jgi:hypothetical protein
MSARCLLAVVWVAACGGGDGQVDPRCRTLCAIDPPAIEGAGDVCSAASAALCEDDCAVRIAGTESPCASCLLEEACFEPECEGDDAPGNCDGTGQCTVTGREGSCTYPMDDQDAYEDCERQVNPLREVDCATEYRPVVECAAPCGDSTG